MFSIYNTGKTKLYNVKAAFAGDSITGGDTFVGNLDSGATGNVDTMVTGAAATMDEGKITVTVSYENEAGEVRSEEYETTLYVSEPFVEEMPDDLMDMNEGEMEPAGLPLWAKIVIPAAVVFVIAGAVLLILRKRNKEKKRQELTIEDLDDED